MELSKGAVKTLALVMAASALFLILQSAQAAEVALWKWDEGPDAGTAISTTDVINGLVATTAGSPFTPMK
jgi:hypothetical protein